MDPITASYTQVDADWTISVSGLGKTLTARAPGIIAARDRADQLVEKLAPDQPGRTVVHLLNGSALEFTATYLKARLATPPAEAAPTAPAKKPRKPAAAPSKPAGAKPKRTKPASKPAKRTSTAAEEPKKAATHPNGAEGPDAPGALGEATKPVANSGQAPG